MIAGNGDKFASKIAQILAARSVRKRETRNTGLLGARRWRTWSTAIRGVLLAGIPSLSIYLYTRLLLSSFSFALSSFLLTQIFLGD